MHTRIIHTASELIGELDKNLPPETWRQILQVFVPAHIADILQIQQFVGLDREKFRRVMDRLQNAALGLPPIFHQLDHSITRPGVCGKRPSIYLLGETGALLLNELGYLNVPSLSPEYRSGDLARLGTAGHPSCGPASKHPHPYGLHHQVWRAPDPAPRRLTTCVKFACCSI